jgi:hypothetical protein
MDSLSLEHEFRALASVLQVHRPNSRPFIPSFVGAKEYAEERGLKRKIRSHLNTGLGEPIADAMPLSKKPIH